METLSLIGNAFAGMMNPMSILLLIVGVAAVSYTHLTLPTTPYV